MADATCTIDGCHGEHVARGWCGMHYQRWHLHGDPHSNPRTWLSSEPCAADGCDAARICRQWCKKHYSRWKRHGDPLGGRRSSGDPLPPCSVQGCTAKTSRILLGMCEMHYNRVYMKGDVGPVHSLRIIGDDEARFWSYVDKEGPLSPHCIFRGPCWQWTSPLNTNGYGAFGVNGRSVGPHRWAYENFVGPIPDDYEVDHLCHNRGCVNFEQHLEVVTHAVNGQRRAIPAQLMGWAAPL